MLSQRSYKRDGEKAPRQADSNLFLRILPAGDVTTRAESLSLCSENLTEKRGSFFTLEFLLRVLNTGNLLEWEKATRYIATENMFYHAPHDIDRWSS